MEFISPQLRAFKETLMDVASRFSLNPDKLSVEFFAPNCQAIFVEHVGDQDFKIHINLQENRIVSIQSLSDANNGFTDRLKEKYRQYMK